MSTLRIALCATALLVALALPGSASAVDTVTASLSAERSDDGVRYVVHWSVDAVSRFETLGGWTLVASDNKDGPWEALGGMTPSTARKGASPVIPTDEAGVPPDIRRWFQVIGMRSDPAGSNASVQSLKPDPALTSEPVYGEIRALAAFAKPGPPSKKPTAAAPAAAEPGASPGGLGSARGVAPPVGLVITAPEDGDGLNLDLEWTEAKDAAALALLRATSPEGPWSLVTATLPPETTSFSDKVTTEARTQPPADEYHYKLVALREILLLPPLPAEGDREAAEKEQITAVLAAGVVGPVVSGRPSGSWLRLAPGPLLLLLLILGVGGLMYWFTAQARAGKEIFIRRIPGIDAIEEGIGRATEMGKPVLYVPGIDELQDIQTIASMLILGQVSKMVAEYQTDIIVSCCIPIVREVADEVVKAGFYQAGHPDAYNPGNIRFISSEQFAFCAGTNGIIYREKPATNIYLGRFFAESLILAETGFINKSIQIAGTAEATQLPFFIAACDYTLIGEELFAVSAYLSKDPRLVSSLKASDWVKVFVICALIIGTLLHTLGSDWVVQLFTIAAG